MDKRAIITAGILGAAMLVGAAVVVPSDADSQARSLSLRSAPGSFTPASADPGMARVVRRSGISNRRLRFTPSANRERERPVTVAVRANSNSPRRAAREAEAAMASTSATSVTAITPSAYNLGVSVGWRRFSVSGDVARIDTGVVPGQSRETAEAGVSYRGDRWSTRVQVSSDRPTELAPPAVVNEGRVALDVGGSYSIARNVDITGGVRYQRNYRIERPEDERRDSQAVYVGTAFRF